MLFEQRAVTRTFDTPAFRGMTFFEVQARSIINRVPDASRVPFRWTINPYRGCSHSCVYCYARKSHTYLDLDSGHDFDSKIVVKVNAPDLVRKELAAARWRGEHIAMGTNVDCYQRAEGRYRLMPGILAALRDVANPFSILTKGTLILRDLDLICEAAEVTDVGLAVSAGCADTELWRELEPGAPSPQRRLEVCAAFTAAGLPCAVLMGPVVPFLSDSPAQLENTVRQIAQAGAASVTPIVLHLRTGAREWFFRWLGEAHPEPGAPLPRTLRPRRLRSRGLPEAGDRAGQGAGQAPRRRARRARQRAARQAAALRTTRPEASGPPDRHAAAAHAALARRRGFQQAAPQGSAGSPPPGQQGQGPRDEVAGAAGHPGAPGGRSPGLAGPRPPRRSRTGPQATGGLRGVAPPG